MSKLYLDLPFNKYKQIRFRMRIANDEVLIAPEDMSADFTTAGIWLGYVKDYAIQLIFTGTPEGTFTLEASNDLGQPNSATEIKPYCSQAESEPREKTN